MRAVPFKGQNIVFAKDQPQYIPLPAHKDEDGIVTSCWEMSFRERIRVLFTGKIYAQIMTFNKQLQPQRISVHNPVGKGNK